MKKAFYCLILISVHLSCKNAAKPGDDIVGDSLATVKSEALTDTSPQALIKRFTPFFKGFWVKKEYVESIAKTLSPLRSFDKANGLVAFRILTDEIHGDSVLLAGGWNNHEGGDMRIKFRLGQNVNSLKTDLSLSDDKPGDFYELGYRESERDTNLILYHYNKNKKIIQTDVYRRDLPENNRTDHTVDVGYRIVNNILVAGNYIANDSVGTVTKVKMDDVGNISGFGELKYYMVNIDFVEGYRQNLDELSFFSAERKQYRSYAFNIVKDTVKLYETSLSADSVNLVSGKLAYKLVKQK